MYGAEHLHKHAQRRICLGTFNNEWDGLFADNTEAINNFEQAVKAIQTPASTGGNPTAIIFFIY